MSAAEQQSIDAAALLDEVAAFYRRFMVMTAEQLTVVVLWIAHAHAISAAPATGRLHVSSPEPESGKSTVIEIAAELVPGPMLCVRPSEAVLFRTVADEQPTVLIDEIDTIFGPNAGEYEGVRAFLNAGHRPGATVPRCVKVGNDWGVARFPVYAAVALAGIGGLPDTTDSRCFPIRLKRARRGERPEKFRPAKQEQTTKDLCERLAAWLGDKATLDRLRDAEPQEAPGLTARQHDIWEPLLALADEAGGDWPKNAREAAKVLCARRPDDLGPRSLGVHLLGDVRRVFDEEKEGGWMGSAMLVLKLHALPETPWAERGVRARQAPHAEQARPLAARVRRPPRGHAHRARVQTGQLGGRLGLLPALGRASARDQPEQGEGAGRGGAGGVHAGGRHSPLRP